MSVRRALRGVILLGLLGLAACEVSCEGCEPQPRGASLSGEALPRSDAAQLARALEKTAAYFEQVAVRGDQGFLLGRAARLLGPAFEQWSERLQVDPAVLAAAKEDPAVVTSALEAALWSLRAGPSRDWPAEKAPSVAPTRVSRRFEPEDGAKVVAMMRAALTCKPSAALPADFTDGVTAPADGYLLTHQLLTAALAYERGCLPQDRALALRSQLATRVLAEHRGGAAPITDLSIERMAVLCYVGLCDWVPAADVDALVAAQDASGAWGSHGPDGMGSIDWTAHSAALGFYVLAKRWSHTAGHEAAAPALPRPTSQRTPR